MLTIAIHLSLYCLQITIRRVYIARTYFWMLFQVLGNFHGIFTVLVHPHSQCLYAAVEQVGIKWRLQEIHTQYVLYVYM